MEGSSGALSTREDVLRIERMTAARNVTAGES